MSGTLLGLVGERELMRFLIAQRGYRQVGHGRDRQGRSFPGDPRWCGLPALRKRTRADPEPLPVDIFVNCIYLTAKIPSFVDPASIAAIGDKRNLRCVVDVSCDTTNPNNPIPIYAINTTFDKPTVDVPGCVPRRSAPSNTANDVTFPESPLDLLSPSSRSTTSPRSSRAKPQRPSRPTSSPPSSPSSPPSPNVPRVSVLRSRRARRALDPTVFGARRRRSSGRSLERARWPSKV